MRTTKSGIIAAESTTGPASETVFVIHADGSTNSITTDEYAGWLDRERSPDHPLIRPWMRELGENDHFIAVVPRGDRPKDALVIYGVVDGPAYAEPHLANYRFTRCFSRECPGGEVGDTHLSTICSEISAEEFVTAKRNNWPNATVTMRDIGGGHHYTLVAPHGNLTHDPDIRGGDIVLITDAHEPLGAWMRAASGTRPTTSERYDLAVLNLRHIRRVLSSVNRRLPSMVRGLAHPAFATIVLPSSEGIMLENVLPMKRGAR